jgi:hypothetical protein
MLPLVAVLHSLILVYGVLLAADAATWRARWHWLAVAGCILVGAIHAGMRVAVLVPRSAAISKSTRATGAHGRCTARALQRSQQLDGVGSGRRREAPDDPPIGH